MFLYQYSISYIRIFRVNELIVARLVSIFSKNGILKNVKKIHMDSEKSINLFEIKKG